MVLLLANLRNRSSEPVDSEPLAQSFVFVGFFFGGGEGVGSNSIANDVSMVITLLIFISPLK